MIDIMELDQDDSDLAQLGVAFLSQKRSMERALKMLETMRKDLRSDDATDEERLLSGDVLQVILVLREALA